MRVIAKIMSKQNFTQKEEKERWGGGEERKKNPINTSIYKASLRHSCYKL